MKELSSEGTGSAGYAAGPARGGFSLVEVLLALVLLGIGMSMASSLIQRGQLVHDFSRRRLAQIELASRVLAELRLAREPQRLVEKPAAHVSAPQLRYRTRLVPAALPDDLRLVEVEIAAEKGAVLFRCRGVVPSRNLVPGPTPSPTAPASNAPPALPAPSPTAGGGGT
jgi:prepilin-type N-terminal cleavage/methylation domain-containing protein